MPASLDRIRERTPFVRRNILRLAALMAALLTALVVTLVYWQIVAADRLLDHPNNRRLAWKEERICRGGLYDRTGIALAKSEFEAGEQIRQYPLGEAAALLIGYRSPRYGRTGLEARYQSRLSGLTARRTLLDLRDEILGRQAHGDDVFTTLDAGLQRAAWEGLGGRPGAVVALEPATGAIRCLVSSPAFDPDTVDDDWQKLNTAPDHPLFNRATQGLYPPGSTFKVVTAAAAAEFGVVKSSDRFTCTGTHKIDDYKIHCERDRAHGTMDFERALVVSCNCTFGQLAADLGPERFQDMAERFGLGREVRMELPVATSRLLNSGQEWYTTLLAQTGFGQGQLAVTSLQMALVAATLANGGKQAAPYLVNEVRSYEGQILERHHPVSARTVTSPPTAERVAGMMAAVVAKGSTRKVFGGLSAIVAGKTGTAQNPHGRAHAWFIAFAPASAPTLAVAVVAENAGSGSQAAAPIARKVIAAHLRASS
jgi:peptidoglycan glycosyltransferase